MIDRPLFIGCGIHASEGDRIKYLSNFNFSERRTIVWDPANLAAGLSEKLGWRTDGLRLSPSEVDRAHDLLRQRNEDMVHFIENGGDLIIAVRDLSPITYKDEYGDNCEINLIGYTPLEFAKPLGRSGESLVPNCPANVLKLVEALISKPFYSALITNKDVKPLLIVPNSKEIAGGYLHTKFGGCLIFLPTPRLWNQNQTGGSDVRTAFLQAALQLPDLLRQTPSASSSLPSWSLGYRLPEEQVAFERIENHQQEIARNQAAIEELHQLIAECEPLKRLFTANDSEFEGAVRDALEMLGIKARLGPNKHCDVIGMFEGTLLAVEAKGLKRGARPSHVTQCQRWITEVRSTLSQAPNERDEITQKYAAVLKDLGVPIPESDEDNPTEISVRGLLVINAHCEAPLRDRENPSEPAFNDSVEKFISREGLGALTGLQLLGMVLAAASDESQKSEIATSLITLTGVHPAFTDWQSFIHVPTSSIVDDTSETPDKGK